ncbi:hypothetical protein K491DRAFT_689793 [Lophiostoma macrostomum CBS 122681]|uniref:Uncharacterized protein n=1 Tax=Lophiostoma macrostomum CBS 122681 TaxID=1314788 RepID=A0A6A6TG69_9PLEO|nr:hypothetical protein K491DRAFT_689793 [Lophiostoma macrostomum CBS 122681]
MQLTTLLSLIPALSVLSLPLGAQPPPQKTYCSSLTLIAPGGSPTSRDDMTPHTTWKLAHDSPKGNW